MPRCWQHGRLRGSAGNVRGFRRLRRPPPGMGGRRPAGGAPAWPPATHPGSGAVDAHTAMGGAPLPGRPRSRWTPKGVTAARSILRLEVSPRSMSVSARLDRRALWEWCQRRLGSEPEQVLFETGYLSQVIGLRLIDGRDIVVKVRAWQERLTGCGQVQHSLSGLGSQLRDCWF